MLASASVGVFDSASVGVLASALRRDDSCPRGDADVSLV